MNGAQIADRFLAKPFLVSTGSERIDERRHAAVIVVNAKVSTSNDGNLLAAGAKHFSEHTDEIATILGSSGHKNVVFQKPEEFWSKRPTFNNLLLEASLVGLRLVCVEQPYSLCRVDVNGLLDFCRRHVAAILKKAV